MRDSNSPLSNDPRRRGYVRSALSVALVVAAAVLAVAASLPPRPTSEPAPKLVMERSLNLGRLDVGQAADCRFQVTNAGHGPLVIHGARAACRCQGVYRETESGVKEAVRELTVPPGQSVGLGLSFAASGELNRPVQLRIELSTNDPTDPTAAVLISYTPTAKLYCVPQEVVFGNVTPGATVTEAVGLFTDGRAGKFQADQLSCSPADLFAVRYVPMTPGQADVALGNSIAQLGRLEITFRAPREAQTIHRPLVLLQEGKEIFRLPVTARVVPDFELLPAVLTLPRHSQQGDVYSFDVCCRSRTGEPFRLRVQSKSANFTVTLPQSEPAPVHLVKVAYVGDRTLKAEVTETIELMAASAERSADLRMEVRVAPGPDGQDPLGLPKEQ